MSDIFISYRRDDSAGETRSIRDRLGAVFSRRRVFMDVDAIPVGVDFREYLKTSIQHCRVALVVIGPKWAESTNAEGRRRLDDPQDYVRIEIELALKREGSQEICIIPVLLNGARMPAADELPESLRPVTYRNAIDVRHGSFERDVKELIRNVARYVPPAAAKPRRKPIPQIAVIAAAVVVVLVAMATIGWVVWSNSGDDPQAVAAAKRIEAKLAGNNLPDANNLYNDFLNRNPHWADTQSFRNVKVALEQENAKAARHRKFQELLVRLKKMPPGKITKEIDELWKLAQSPEEQKQVNSLREDVASNRAIERENYNTQMSQELATIRSEVEKLRSVGAGTAQAVKKGLLAAEDSLARLSDGSKLEAQTRNEAQELHKSLQALLDAPQTAPWDKTQQQRITAHVDKPQAYWKAQSDFVYEHPLSQTAADFRSLAGELPLWVSMNGWEEVLGNADFAQLRHLSPGDARKLGVRLDAAAQEFGLFPLRREYLELRAYLDKIGSRLDQMDPPAPHHMQFIRSLSDDDFLSAAWMIESKTDGKRYYGTGPLPQGGPVIRVNVAKNRRDKMEIKFNRSQDSLDLAPQTKLAKKIVDALNERQRQVILTDGWERVFCGLLKAVRDEPKLDPILAVLLYDRVLLLAAQGSYPIACAFARDRETLNNITFDTSVNWLDPVDAQAHTARNTAKRVLQNLGSVEAQSRRALDLAEKLAAIEAPRLEWRGWLCRGEADSWTICGDDIPDEGALYVVVPHGAQKGEIDGRLVPIGRLEGGKPRWEGDQTLFIEGRPLYLRLDHYQPTDCSPADAG